MERFDGRIVACRGQRGRVKHAMNLEAAPTHSSSSLARAGTASDGGDADERCDLAAIEFVQFGQLSDQAGAEHRTYPVSGLQQTVAFGRPPVDSAVT